MKLTEVENNPLSEALFDYNESLAGGQYNNLDDYTQGEYLWTDDHKRTVIKEFLDIDEKNILVNEIEFPCIAHLKCAMEVMRSIKDRDPANDPLVIFKKSGFLTYVEAGMPIPCIIYFLAVKSSALNPSIKLALISNVSITLRRMKIFGLLRDLALRVALTTWLQINSKNTKRAQEYFKERNQLPSLKKIKEKLSPIEKHLIDECFKNLLQLEDVIENDPEVLPPISGELLESFEEIVSSGTNEILLDKKNKPFLLDILFNEPEINLEILVNYVANFNQSSHFLVTYCCCNPERWVDEYVQEYYKLLILSYIPPDLVSETDKEQFISKLIEHAKSIVLNLLKTDKLVLDNSQKEIKHPCMIKAKKSIKGNPPAIITGEDVSDLEDEKNIVISELKDFDAKKKMQSREILKLKNITDGLVKDNWSKIYEVIKDTPTGRIRPEETMREIFNAILYRERRNCCWRALPLPEGKIKYTSARSYYYSWKKKGLFDIIINKINASENLSGAAPHSMFFPPVIKVPTSSDSKAMCPENLSPLMTSGNTNTPPINSG